MVKVGTGGDALQYPEPIGLVGDAGVDTHVPHADETRIDRPTSLYFFRLEGFNRFGLSGLRPQFGACCP